MNKHFFSESSVINFFCDVLGVGTNVFSHKEKEFWSQIQLTLSRLYYWVRKVKNIRKMKH